MTPVISIFKGEARGAVSEHAVNFSVAGILASHITTTNVYGVHCTLCSELVRIYSTIFGLIDNNLM